MSAEPELPPASDAPAPSSGSSGGGIGAMISSILSRLWALHPFILMGVALSMALTAYLLLPQEAKEPVPPLSSYYLGALSDFDKLLSPALPLTQDDLREASQSAYVRMSAAFKHPDEDIRLRPDWINPHLLLAEAARIYADYAPARRKELIEQAGREYSLAIDWLERNQAHSTEDATRSLFSYDNRSLPSEKEFEIRVRRQADYLRFYHAVMSLQTGASNLAREELQRLIDRYQQEDLQRQRNELLGLGQDVRREATFLPKKFELTDDDRNRFDYYLGKIYETLDQPEEAEREYRKYLVDASASQERFDALMRLGTMYAKRGDETVSKGEQKTIPQAEANRMATSLYRAAADKYIQIVDDSAPETILREAYYRGGLALLSITRLITVGRDTWWDFSGRVGQGMLDQLEQISGQQVPERTRLLPGILGKFLLDGALTPDPGLVSGGAFSGVALDLASRPRRTLMAERDALLSRARTLFSGAQAGGESELTGAADAMIAHTWLVSGMYDRARSHFQHTQTNYADAAIQLSCRLGIAESYLKENELDRARVRLIGGVEKTESSLLSEDDIRDWPALCRRLQEEGQSNPDGLIGRIWNGFSEQTRKLVDKTSRTARMSENGHTLVLNELNRMLSSPRLYDSDELADLHLPEQALILMQRDRRIFSELETLWLNRLVLDTLFAREFEPTELGEVIEPLPPKEKLPHDTLSLVSEDRIVALFLQLSRAYQQEAELLRKDSESIARSPEQAMAVRRATESASILNEVLLVNYTVNRPEVLMETAGLYSRLAELAALPSTQDTELAREMTAKAAATYSRVALEAASTPLEEESLLKAGQGFYAAEMFERAGESLEAFRTRYPTADRIGEVCNLLGRSYRNLGQLTDAVRVYLENSQRKTPDGRKSLYYLGAVYLQLGSSGIDPEVLGYPEDPLPHEENGVLRINSALQAFNHVRRVQGIDPSSRPWRWATFDLGTTWYRIAERERKGLDTSENPANAAEKERILGLYENAEAVLREALERYVLKTVKDGQGIDPEREPEDYAEVQRQRLVAEYYLGQTLRYMGGLGDREKARESRTRFADIIDLRHYPETIFSEQITAHSYLVRSVLGQTEGPVVDIPYLRQIKWNTYFLLGQSYFNEGETLRDAADANGARDAFRESYRVYQQALDRLPPRDAPAVLYQMGECLMELDRRVDAANLYRLVVSRSENLLREEETSGVVQTGAADLGPSAWTSLAEGRLRDIEQLRRP